MGHQVVVIFAIAADMCMALLLLVAALAKFDSPASIKATIQGLGISNENASLSLAYVLMALELITSALLVIYPGAVAPLAGVLVLATSFAAAGALALARRDEIRCSCLGAMSPNSRLGRNQLLGYPAWLIGLAIAARAPSRSWGPASGIAIFVAITIAAAVHRVIITLRLQAHLKAQRVAQYSLNANLAVSEDQWS